MNFNDKFLNVCFKFCKAFLSIALVLTMVSCVILLFNVCNQTFKMNNIGLEYKFGSSDSAIENLNKSVDNEKEVIENQYKKQIVKILKENGAKESTADVILNAMVNVEKRDRKEFVNNLSQYYKDVTKYFIDLAKKEYPNITDKEIEQLFAQEQIKDREIIERYFERYDGQVTKRNEQQQTLQIQRSASLISLSIALGIFVILLIVPILIRIEENTRK